MPLQFSSKTAYRLTHSFKEFSLINDVSKPFYPSICKPLHISLIMRHGERNPSKRHIKAGDSLSKSIENVVFTESFRHLKGWSNEFNLNDAQLLTNSGGEASGNIGKRFAKRFHDLFKSAYTDEFQFLSSFKSRCIDTGSYFQSSFSKALGLAPNQDISIRNDIMRFFDNCTLYINTVEERKEARQDYYTFLENELLTRTAEDVIRNISPNLKNNTEILWAMYFVSAYEEAVFGKSIWTDVFNDEQLEILSYAEDLHQYWKRGYGHKINYEQSCPLLKHISNHFNDVIDAVSRGSDRYTKGVFNFGHAETILPLITLLGLFKDENHLTGSSHIRNRHFKCSRIAPFAANIAFVLHRCNQNQTIRDEEYQKKPEIVNWPIEYKEYMIQLLYNEIPMNWPSSESSFISIDEFHKNYHKSMNCSFADICFEKKYVKEEL